MSLKALSWGTFPSRKWQEDRINSSTKETEINPWGCSPVRKMVECEMLLHGYGQGGQRLHFCRLLIQVAGKSRASQGQPWGHRKAQPFSQKPFCGIFQPLSGRGPRLSQKINSLWICFPAIFLPPAVRELPCSGGGGLQGLQLCQGRIQQGHLLLLLMVPG